MSPTGRRATKPEPKLQTLPPDWMQRAERQGAIELDLSQVEYRTAAYYADIYEDQYGNARWSDAHARLGEQP